MAISDSGTRDQYVASAAQTVFAYTFEIFDDDDIAVEQNGTLLAKGTNYTVSGVGVDTGGNITLLVGATSGDVLTLYRDMALERVTDYQQNGDFLADEVNDDFDRLWAALQQNESTAIRAIRPTIDDTALNSTNTELANIATRGGRALGFAADGTLTYFSSVIAGGDFTDVTTTAAMTALASPSVGDVVQTAEFSTGSGGGGTYDAVLVGTTAGVDLPDTFKIIVSTADPLICFVLRDEVPLILSRWGAKSGIDSAPILRAAKEHLRGKGGVILLPRLASGGVYSFNTLDTNGTDICTIDYANLSINGDSYGAIVEAGIACDNIFGLAKGFLNFECINIFARGSDDGGTTVYADSFIATTDDTGETSRFNFKRLGGEYFNSHGINIWTVDSTLEQVKMSFCQGVGGEANTKYGIRIHGQESTNVPTTSVVLTDCGSFDCDNGTQLDKVTYLTLNSVNNEKCELSLDIQRADTVVLNACGAEEIAQVWNFGDTSDSLKSITNLVVNGFFVFDIVVRKSTSVAADRLFSYNRTQCTVSGLDLSASQSSFVNKTPHFVDTNSTVTILDDSVLRTDIIVDGTGQVKFPNPQDYNESTGLSTDVFLSDTGDDDINGVSTALAPYLTWNRVRQVLPQVMNQKYNLKIVGTFTGDIECRNIRTSLGQDTGVPVFEITGNAGIGTDAIVGNVGFAGCFGGEGGNGIQLDDVTVTTTTVGSSLGVKIKTVPHTGSSIACNVKASHVVIDGMSVTGTPTTGINLADSSIAKVRNTSGAVGTNRISAQASGAFKSGTEFTGGADATSQGGQIWT